MKTFLLGLLAGLVVVCLLGKTRYEDNAGDGIPVQPQVVSASPSAPFACALGVRGKMIYVDDTDDTAESYLCFCGVDADDATYIWLRVADPTANCF